MAAESVPGSPQIYDLDRDDLIDIFFDKPKKGGHDHGGRKDEPPFADTMIEKSSGGFSYTPVFGAEALRRLYPKHSLVMTPYGGALGYPGVSIQPLEKTPLITNSFFVPLSERLAGVPGILMEEVLFGAFKVTWNELEFIQFTVTYPTGFGVNQQHFILHDGPEERTRLLLLTIGAWADKLHEEIWVFDQGWWQKDHGLWAEVQKASWSDVILKEDFKKALQKDVYGFFGSESIYKELGIAWKRGLIMHGPPGNGKTISLKTIMKTCGDKGFQPLYVKSFQSWKGEEGAMADVFNKARQLSPCVIVLEDLDSLINDRNRSFFLNQVDGISGNDGLLLIGTTNHFDRLDPGLSTRPSRFDRKYKFDDPDFEERTLYVEYWRKKLQGNKSIDFSDDLVREIAEATDRFSFAYLKEAFVSTLVSLAGWEGDDKPTFGALIKSEIKNLRKQLDKTTGYDYIQSQSDTQAAGQDPKPTSKPARPPRPNSSNERDIRAILDALSDRSPTMEGRRFFRGAQDYGRAPPPTRRSARPTPEDVRKDRDIHSLLDALADHLETSDASSFRRYEAGSSFSGYEEGEDSESNTYRGLFDQLSERERDTRLFSLQQHSQQRPVRQGPARGGSFFGGEEPDWSCFRAPPRTSGSGAAFNAPVLIPGLPQP